MSNEAQLYSFIEKYLMGMGIEIIQNEVEFSKQLKKIDLLAKSYDSITYYLIEVKKDEISMDDYYNLKYIIENNNIGKRKKGMLIGNCNNEELKELLKKDYYIELIELKHILKVENMDNNRNINYHKSCYNPYKKYFANLFKYISDETLDDFSILDDYSIKIKYKIKDNKYLIFKGHIEQWKEIYGRVCVETYDYLFEEKELSIVDNDINIKDLRKILYKIKYSNIFDHKEIAEFFEYVNLEYLHSVLDTLSNIVNLKEIKFMKKDINTLEVIDCELLIVKINHGKLMLLPSSFSDFILYDLRHNKEDKYYKELKEACMKTKDNNEFNFLEFTNVIVENRLIEPLKKIEKEDFYNYRIILELSLKDNKNIKKTYKVKRIKNYESVDFYLFLNWDIMIDFQRELNRVVSKSVNIIYENDYIKNHRWKKIKNNIGKANTNRFVVEKYIDDKLGADVSLKDIFERSIWGFDEEGRYVEL